jgi:hypothetical protein
MCTTQCTKNTRGREIFKMDTPTNGIDVAVAVPESQSSSMRDDDAGAGTAETTVPVAVPPTPPTVQHRRSRAPKSVVASTSRVARSTFVCLSHLCVRHLCCTGCLPIETGYIPFLWSRVTTHTSRWGSKVDWACAPPTTDNPVRALTCIHY